MIFSLLGVTLSSPISNFNTIPVYCMVSKNLFKGLLFCSINLNSQLLIGYNTFPKRILSYTT